MLVKTVVVIHLIILTTLFDIYFFGRKVAKYKYLAIYSIFTGFLIPILDNMYYLITIEAILFWFLYSFVYTFTEEIGFRTHINPIALIIVLFLYKFIGMLIAEAY